MKKISLLFICSLLILSFNLTNVYAATKYQTGYIKVKKGSFLMSQAKEKSEKVIKIPQSTKIKYKKYNKTWSIVKFENNKGYIKNKEISSYKVSKETKAKYKPSKLRHNGVLHWGGWKWTWYTQRILPGRTLKIPGRHLDSHGMVCDKGNFICLASSRLRKGTIVNTPFGKQGKVYDCGCGRYILDVYTNW